jgi:hypothetical protein
MKILLILEKFWKKKRGIKKVRLKKKTKRIIRILSRSLKTMTRKGM